MAANCCEDTLTQEQIDNAALSVNSRGALRSVRLPELPDPIPKEIEDADWLKKFFDQYKYVPYAGTTRATGHSLLYWYIMLSKLSPTHGSAISKLVKYAFGGKAYFERAEDPEYDLGEDEIEMTPTEKANYLAAIKEYVSFSGGIVNFHKWLAKALKVTGNGWVEMSYSETLSIPRFSLKYLKPTSVMYKLTKPGEMRVVGISPYWTDQYLQENKPRQVPLFPNFVADEMGVNRTIFHLKEGEDVWYGKPDSEAGDLYKYREVQDAIYVIRQAAGNFTGQMIIEVEGIEEADDNDAKSLGFDSFADRVEHQFTQKGQDPQSVLFTSRPMGAKEMFIFQVKPNTNENWYVDMGKLSSEHVLRSHGATKRFMAFDQAVGMGGQNAFIEDYILNVEPVIKELRYKVLNFTNAILTEIWKITGKEDLNQFSVSFESPVKDMVEMYTETQKNALEQTRAVPATGNAGNGASNDIIETQD
jgi:hypothetical protein